MTTRRAGLRQSRVNTGGGDAAQRQAISTTFERDWETLVVSARVAALAAGLGRQTGDVETAAYDVLSRAYTTAQGIAGRYDLTRPPVPWLKAIIYQTARSIRNEAAARRSRERPMVDESAEHELLGQLRDGSSPLDPEGRLPVEELLSLVPPAEAELLRLADVDGYPAGDIAQRLEISPGAVYTRLHRARKRLRDEWAAAHLAQENNDASQ